MAKKENEENKDVNQEPEEDFGLPDLEFEELGDIDEEEFDEAELENVEEEIAELIGDTTEEDELSIEDISDESLEDTSAQEVLNEDAETETLEDIGVSDEDTSGTSSDEETVSEESGEALPPIEDELQKETIDEELDEVEKFISEITADDVEEDKGESAPVGMFATDRNASQEEEEPAFEETPSYASGNDESGTSKSFTRVIIFGLVGAVVIAFGFLMLQNQFGDSEPVGEAEAEAPVEEPAPVVEETPVAEEPVQEEPVAETPPAQPVSTASSGTPGEVSTITSSAGRYYIVVASFIDDDMANDHGRDLASQGASVKIINPFNERKFYRVSIADYGTKEEAVNAREQFKSQYGDDIWALKY